MEFRLTVKMDGDAFAGTEGDYYPAAVQLGDVLGNVSETIMGRGLGQGPDSGIVRDDNGNTVGRWSVTDGE